MTVHSRNKGLRGEREVTKAFEAAGGVVLQLEGQGDHLIELADFVFHVEAKRRERIEIVRWCHQAETEAAQPYYVPLVVWRQSREPWRATLPLDLFLDVATS